MGDDFKYGEENESFKSYINLPSQLRHNLSITNNMNQMNEKNLDTSAGHHNYHNPLVKALSNSNLNMFNSITNTNQLQLSKQNTNVHSVVDLLGLSNDDDTVQHHLPPPVRPPPPVPTQKPAATTFKDIFGQEDMIATSSELSTPSQDLHEETLVQFSDLPPQQPAPLIFVESSSSLNNNSNSNAFLGFEDDFSTFNPAAKEDVNKISPSTTQPPPLPPPPTSSLPARPPPLPPQPTASFSLFDDPFDTPVVQTTATLPNRPLPPPPPLPPMPPNLAQKTTNNNSNSSSYMNDLESINLTTSKATTIPPPLPPMPTRPQPPPLPPLPPAIKPNVVTNNNTKSNPFDDLDPFGDSFNPIPQQQQQQFRQPPLPPPRPNHFK